MSSENPLVFYVNGRQVEESHPDPETTLLQYLRQKLKLVGTKLGCGEGGCGACTVMLSKYDPVSQTVRHFSANACLAPLCAMHGLAVTTVEGIGSVKNGLHPVQERIAKSHGSQCGFCTPGIVMSMYTLLRNNPLPTQAEMESAFEGNLCRCTGYRPILDGFRTFTKEYCQMGEKCCRNSNFMQCNGNTDEGLSSELFDSSKFLPPDSSQDPIFPPALRTDKYDTQSLTFMGERTIWYRPTSLKELLDLKHTYPEAKLVIGNTEVGVEIKLKNMHYKTMIAPSHIPELNKISKESDGITFGASVTLSMIEETLQDSINKNQDCQTRMYRAVVEMLRWFAGHQIRNVAAVSGNIMTASPISDLNPLFLAAGVTLTVASKDGGTRQIVMDEKFFLGYRKTAVKPEEVLISVKLPFTQQNEYFCGYKQANRREDDIAIVNSGIQVLFEPDSNTIKGMRLAFGGMAPTTVMATTAMQKCVGRKWEDDLVADMAEWLASDLPLPPGSPGGMTEYRRTLCISFFYKFYLTVLMQLKQKLPGVIQSKVPSSHKSATAIFQREPTKSTQVYEEVPSGQMEQDPLGRPLAHLSAAKQATGEAIYIDDIPLYENEKYLAIVTSQKAHARIVDMDPSEASKMPGFVDFVSHKDIQGHNKWGIIADEEIFATEKVLCMGQVIGAVVADTQVHAQRAAKAVKVVYEELEPIITIKDAIKAGSFYTNYNSSIRNGDLVKGFEKADHVVEGEVSMGGQEHFYLETHASLAVPRGEDGEMELFVSTQNPAETQHVVAEALGLPANKIVCRVKRMGGGFGGKETRNIAFTVPVAVAAAKLGCPVRCMLDRDEDMVSSGTRHPFYGKYKVGFTKDGKITAVECDVYNNAGHSLDLSGAVMDRALFHSDASYKIPNIRVTGYLCKTNIPSNTAFRGFGGPQGMFIAETWIEHIAETLDISVKQVREINMYNEGETTHFNQPLIQCNIKRCWNECLERADYNNRRKDIDIFNSENRWKKRGISIIPTKFGISYTALFLNQAGALVIIYKDGSVLITHGGTEMGQGLHTKMIQVAARTLRIPASKIHISETSTNTVPNTSATAASASSDLNGMAIQNACQILLGRLEPYMNANPKGSWEDWVNTAYFDRTSLSTTGFYKTPDIGYDFKTNSGKPFNYFSFGVACSEVEIDCLTGDHKVLRTDIVMDVGVSLNPAIDIGQIEGGFTQGYGLMMLEQQKYSPNGFQFTRGPGNYKIPGFGDVPGEFNVSLLKGSVNNRAVYSSKAIGEPPLFLAASVFFATKDAISSARVDADLSGYFQLQSPATPERIRMACQDEFTNLFPEAPVGSYKPWFVEL
uniref:xanthine dehydrogenase n=1 Tax=Crassostrea virginica TaxID=6565 RepID=A0A8B8E2H2_CRAVI|nr:xanthine dehydrogenase/oxidase-like isoform X1 [Crassostrea virginica]